MTFMKILPMLGCFGGGVGRGKQNLFSLFKERMKFLSMPFTHTCLTYCKWEGL